MTDALLTVYDPEEPEGLVDQIELKVRAVQLSEIGQRDDRNLIAFSLETEEMHDIRIREEWIGLNLAIEVAPSAVQGVAAIRDVDETSDRWQAGVA